jgi:hypothetical protein
MVSKRTQVRLLIDDVSNNHGWSAKRIKNVGNEKTGQLNRVSLQVTSPCDAIIGRYSFSGASRIIRSRSTFVLLSLLLEVRSLARNYTLWLSLNNSNLFLFEVDLYFLFNPWHKDDRCAMLSSDQVTEYVLNEHGQIYLGSSDKSQTMSWWYGQFERCVLLSAFALLDRAHLPAQHRVDS